jgi:hypothetical protein
MVNKQCTIIIIIILIALLLIWLLSRTNRSGYYEEGFRSPFNSSKELDNYYKIPTQGIEDYMVDNMTCHPSCCGDQWPVPFDGLTSSEVEKCIENRGKPGPFVRTNYTCTNGIGGTGCPCIDKKAYLFLVNHGTEGGSPTQIEPTFLIRDNVPQTNNQMSPYEQLQSKRSMFSDTRKLNDLDLQRDPQSLDNVVPYGSSLPTKDQRLHRIF